MIDKNTFISRRNALKNIMKEGGIAIFMANNDSPMNYPSNVYRYRQDSTFRYFFSQMRDGIVGAIDFDNNQDMIFGDDFTINDIIWVGDMPSVGKMSDDCGVSAVKPKADLKNLVLSSIKAGRKIHYLPPYRHDALIELSSLLDQNIDFVKQNASEELIKAIVELRLIKTEDEIAELDKVCDIGVTMHQTVMHNCRVGVSEQYLAGLAEGVALSYGTGVSFPIILSQNGETLHNHIHNKTLTEGRLLLVDMGAESDSGYCSDYTRTLPVGGKFTQQQKEIYQAVLDANLESIKIAKPSISWQEVHYNACKILAQRLIAIGLMKGDAEEAVAAGATSLFMPHGLGHALGMDVHDMEGFGENYVGYDNIVVRSKIFGHASLRFGKKIEAGNVLTVEPGIYFIPKLIDMWEREDKFSNFINYKNLNLYRNFGGIRIEDDIVITPTGCRVLGRHLEKTVDELEAIIKQK